MSNWWLALLDLIFPPCCPVCDALVEDNGLICTKCLAGIVHQREINVTIRRLSALDGCRVLLDYTGGARMLLQGIKFKKKVKYATHLRRLLTDKLDIARLPVIDVVVPVPLHARRLKERGFNQTTLIFGKWAEKEGIPWADALARVAITVPQWTLEAKERRKNVKGAFIVTRPESVKGKTILLVDDIVTTGITLNECAKTLKASGAKAVFGLGLAGGADDGSSQELR
ncbi:MAG: phosphoribosyltransferase [Firmicutes bacterium]|nr:phosphoribosyltransferase [Bacillota bacterium]